MSTKPAEVELPLSARSSANAARALVCGGNDRLLDARSRSGDLACGRIDVFREIFERAFSRGPVGVGAGAESCRSSRFEDDIDSGIDAQIGRISPQVGSAPLEDDAPHVSGGAFAPCGGSVVNDTGVSAYHPGAEGRERVVRLNVSHCHGAVISCAECASKQAAPSVPYAPPNEYGYIASSDSSGAIAIVPHCGDDDTERFSRKPTVLGVAMALLCIFCVVANKSDLVITARRVDAIGDTNV